jgi:hypothetical protein
MASAQVYYDDVNEGDAIRPAMEWTDQMNLVRWSVVSENNDKNHYAIFRTHIRKKSQPSMTGQFMMALVDKALTDWAGPAAWVKKLSTQYRSWEFFHDVKTITGTVTAKRTEGSLNLVDIQVQLARGDGTVTVKGNATVALPSLQGGR